jgi:hypothetical protein
MELVYHQKYNQIYSIRIGLCILLAWAQISIKINKAVIQIDSALVLFVAITETGHFAVITGLAEAPIKFTDRPHWGESSSGDDNIQKK